MMIKLSRVRSVRDCIALFTGAVISERRTRTRKHQGPSAWGGRLSWEIAGGGG